MLFGLGLAFYALVIYLITKATTPRNRKGQESRSGVQTAGTASIQTQTRIQCKTTPPPLPVCRARALPAPQSAGPGPDGIWPSQYPRCPICRQRNDGAVQQIVWNSRENAYYCTRKHKFARNGRPII